MRGTCIVCLLRSESVWVLYEGKENEMLIDVGCSGTFHGRYTPPDPGEKPQSGKDAMGAVAWYISSISAYPTWFRLWTLMTLGAFVRTVFRTTWSCAWQQIGVSTGYYERTLGVAAARVETLMNKLTLSPPKSQNNHRKKCRRCDNELKGLLRFFYYTT